MSTHGSSTSTSKHTAWLCSLGRNERTSVMVEKVCPTYASRIFVLIRSFLPPVIMPPSSLAHLTSLDLESPWKFKLRNPANPAASTHAGVLEFIAQEGVVHLPYWMMKTLRLNEGDPIRITGAELPRGKMVKLQAQSVHFLEVSDPKAVYVSKLKSVLYVD
jgi:hypothetical protein